MIPLTVDWLIWSYDVQVGLLRSVQPPLEVRVMPCAESWAAAWASVSLVTAWAGDGSPSTAVATRVAEAATRARTNLRWVITTPDSSPSWTDPENAVAGPAGLVTTPS